MKTLRIAILGAAFAALSLEAIAAVEGHWEVNLVRAGTTVTPSSRGDTQESAWAACQARIPSNNATLVKYVCQTPRFVATVTADTTPPPTCTTPKPADETQPGACPSGTTGSWTQSRTYSSAAYPTCWTAGDWSPSSPPAGACVTDPPIPPAGVKYTDLSSAPACAKVLQYPSKTVVSAAASGLPIHSQGTCYEVTSGEAASVITGKVRALKPGDDLCFHAGTYSGVYGEGTWYGSAQFETYKKGAALLPISIRACPDDVASGGVVELKPTGGRPSIILGDGSRETSKAEYLTFANFKITSKAACISGGGNTTDSSGGNSETGGRYIRVVGIDCSITDATSNTMTGLLDFQNDGWQILASRFTDPVNRVIINNNHGIYAQGGADDWRIAGNYIRVHGGAQIQVHQDGAPKLMERGVIEENEISAAKPGDGRGISVINIDNASTITIRGNYVHDQGQGDWGCYQIYRGQVTISGERCERTQGAPVGLNGGYDGTRKVTIDSSKLCSSTTSARIGAENGATLSQATETNAKACP